MFVKPINVSTEILLDRERCVLCQRCTRFSDQIAGDKFIDLLERGSAQQIGINSAEPFQSYFSGNTIQICPVGALTSAAYRFRARPFDLVSTDTVCEHCAGGCALRTDHRAGAVTRRLARTDPEVNEDWNCDKGRFAFPYVREGDRITRPLVRDADGVLQPTSWTEAMTVAAAGLLAGAGQRRGRGADRWPAHLHRRLRLREVRPTGVAHQRHRLPGPGAFGRGGGVPGGPGGRHIAGARRGDLRRRWRRRPAVLLVALEPEEESPILFLRLRKAARSGSAGVLGGRPDQQRPAQDVRHADRRRAGRRSRPC